MHPLAILLIGMVVIIGAIVVFRLNAFVALIGAAILVSLLAPGEPAGKVTRVAEAFGRTAGSIGIVIALAAIIGTALARSGAADRIVGAFLSLVGERRGGAALCASGFVLSIPVFFDTVFYLLVPLARSMYRRTGRGYLKYLTAVAAGAAATHALVPPTPGPLAVSGILGVDLGVMIAVGSLVALPAASAGLWYAGWIDRRMPVPLRADPRAPVTDGDLAGPSGPHPPRDLPGLMASASPIVLPVLLISANTIVGSVTPEAGRSPFWRQLAAITATLGNANLALLLAAGIAVWVFARHRRPERGDVASLVETSLMSGGVIILITAAGGAFGAMLQAAQVGPEIQAVFAGGRGAGFAFLGLGFVVASLIKVAQGSSTVAMITAAGMLAAMVTGADALPFHTVYLAIAITAGSLVGTWMNDSGFWVFSKMGGVTEMETLRSWTVVSATVGVTALVVTAILAMVMPLR